jgi:autophagy-related protein 101
VLFHRLLGSFKPRTFEVLDVTMVCLRKKVANKASNMSQPGVSNPGIEKLVEDKVDAFWRGMESGANKRGRVRILVYTLPHFGELYSKIVVTLSEKQQRKTWIGYTYEVRSKFTQYSSCTDWIRRRM